MIQLINAYKDKTKIKTLYEFLLNYSDVYLTEKFSLKCNVSSVVISGSERFITEGEYEDEWIDFIRNIDIPLLGICYGMQLISFSFEAMLEKKDRIKGLRKVRILRKEYIFQNLPDNPLLPESHYERVTGVSGSLVVFAISKTGIEGIKVKDRNIFGTQFHFERSKKYGGVIIKDFLKISNEKYY